MGMSRYYRRIFGDPKEETPAPPVVKELPKAMPIPAPEPEPEPYVPHVDIPKVTAKRRK